MKTETMLEKVNQLILTGSTSFKACKTGAHKNWIAEKTFGQLFNFLFFYQEISSLEIKRINENQLSITGWDFDNNLKLFGTINLY